MSRSNERKATPAVAVQRIVRRLVTKDKPGKFNDPTGVVISDLKALLFWATIGITKSRGGYQDDEIVKIIESYANHFKFQLPHKPRFMRNSKPSNGLREPSGTDGSRLK